MRERPAGGVREASVVQDVGGVGSRRPRNVCDWEGRGRRLSVFAVEDVCLGRDG